MHDNFTRVLNNRPTEVPVRRKPIQAVAAETVPAASTAVDSRDPWISGWGVNPRLNGRVPLSLPGGTRTPARVWRSELPPGLAAVALLTANERVVVLGGGRWAIYDSGGRRVATEPVGASEVELDDRGQRIVAADMAGEVHLWRLSDGAADLKTPPVFLRDHLRTRLAVRGPRLVLVSRELDTDVHAPPLQKSMVEVIDLARAPKPGTLQTGIRDSSTLLSAVTDRQIVLATEGRVYFLDLDLAFTDAWAGDFVPMGFSLDEAGRLYLHARVGGAIQLWKLDASGGRLWSASVPPPLALILQPPLIGYDHRVYLVSAQAVLALDARGQALWQYTAQGPLRGALITADGRLLVTEGQQVIGFDGTGRRGVVADAGEPLTTPPALVPGGRLYVASARHLFALQLAP